MMPLKINDEQMFVTENVFSLNSQDLLILVLSLIEFYVINLKFINNSSCLYSIKVKKK
jgi:hypothetical protein